MMLKLTVMEVLLHNGVHYPQQVKISPLFFPILGISHCQPHLFNLLNTEESDTFHIRKRTSG